MAVVGIDFGTLHSKIGVARHRGIDIITNEVSNRATPSLVAFGPKQRAIGEAAKTQETSNFKNTIGSLKRIVGRTLTDPHIENVEKKFINAALTDVDGVVGVDIRYLNERRQFSATQLVAMYLGKLRDIASNELQTGVSDVVIAVPGWYTDIQRRALIDAACTANLSVLRLINDTTATALGYGITKSDLPEAESPRHVCFVDVGHAGLSVAIVAFSKGQLTVKSTAYDPNLGGRDIDYALVEHFAEEFKVKYKIDVMNNPKAIFRLTAGCEKLKKVLSANNESPLNVESIVNDVDATSKLTREQLEELCAGVLNRIHAPLISALAESGLTLEQIDAVELVGGGTRIPAVRARIQDIFPGKQLSTTLNQDEAIARGATFACAMLSPIFRVRDFAIHDINRYPIKVQWDPTPTDPDDDTELLVFPQGNGIPSTKVLSFYRKDAFSIEAVYTDPSSLPGGINPRLSTFRAEKVPADLKGDVACVKLKTRLNLHGIMSFESAYVEEIEEKEEQIPMDVDPAAEVATQPKKKRIVKKIPIPFEVVSSSLSTATLEKMKEEEGNMHEADKLVMDTEDRKNALEEYVYDMRSKIEDRLSNFIQVEEKTTLLERLKSAEDWLYSEDGEDAQKSEYVHRLGSLKAIGDPVNFRYRESEERQQAVAQLRETLNNYMGQAISSDDKFAHIDQKDKQAVVEKVATVQKWLEDQIVRQAERPKNVDPVLTSEEIKKRRDEVIYFATPIFTRPKPRTPVPPGTETPKSSTQTPDVPPVKTENSSVPSEMDID